MSRDLIAELSNHIQWFGSLLIVLFAFFKFNNRPKIVTILGLYGLNSFVFQLLQQISTIALGARFSPQIGNVYVLFETVLLLFFFRQMFESRSIQGILLAASIFYVTFYLVVISNEISIMSSSTRTTRDVLMIIFSIYYFYTILKELPNENLLQMPAFWFNSAILFFFSCTFILSLSLKQIALILDDNMAYFWSVRNLLRACFCGVICFGIWKARDLSKRIEIS